MYRNPHKEQEGVSMKFEGSLKELIREVRGRWARGLGGHIGLGPSQFCALFALLALSASSVVGETTQQCQSSCSTNAAQAKNTASAANTTCGANAQADLDNCEAAAGDSFDSCMAPWWGTEYEQEALDNCNSYYYEQVGYCQSTYQSTSSQCTQCYQETGDNIQAGLGLCDNTCTSPPYTATFSYQIPSVCSGGGYGSLAPRGTGIARAKFRLRTADRGTGAGEVESISVLLSSGDLWEAGLEMGALEAEALANLHAPSVARGKLGELAPSRSSDANAYLAKFSQYGGQGDWSAALSAVASARLAALTQERSLSAVERLGRAHLAIQAEESGIGAPVPMTLLHASEAALRAGGTSEAIALAERAIRGLVAPAGVRNPIPLMHAYNDLGLAYLAQGGTDQAQTALNRSIAHLGNTGLGKAGPELALASALVKAGGAESVLEFLDACARLNWPGAADRVAAWKAEILAGRAPSFAPLRDSKQ